MSTTEQVAEPIVDQNDPVNPPTDSNQVTTESESHPNGVDDNKSSLQNTASNIENSSNNADSTTISNSNHTSNPPSNDPINITKPKVTGKKRKREKTRWGPPPRKKRWGDAQIPQNPTVISSLIKMSNQNTNINTNSIFGNAWNENQTKIFLLKNQLQDVSTRLIAPGAFVATQPDQERSPSPEPIYDQKGVRINTREYRLRDKLQQQRIKIIQQLIELDPNYQAPSDYKPPKLTHKIMMPVDDYPDYNFFGLIVGPRGNTQKEMQKATGCKIAVRGQGACLDKPGRLVHPDDNEPLHVHITAPNQDSLDKATKMIDGLLNEVKTGGGEHKAKQLRELATINGTLRIDARCRICGGQHPIYRCPEKTGEKWTPAEVQCKICGELTHVTEDCKHYKKGKVIQSMAQSRPSIDAEYSAFMQELIGDGPMSSNKPIAAITAPMRSVKNPAVAVIQLGVSMNGNAGYHNVPPPNQNGVAPPAQYVKDGTSGDEKNDEMQQILQQPMMNMGMMMPPMYQMVMPMMAPNPFGMGMMPAMYGMRPMMPPINPYMPRPPMPPFVANPYMPYPIPPPPPAANNGQ